MYGAPPLSRLVWLLSLLAAGFVLPLVLPQYFLYLGNFLMMLAVLAIGLDLLLGWAGQFAFAHIAFFGVGVYGTALLQIRLGIPFVIGMPLAALLAGAIGLLIGFPATRLRTVYLALATFAFAEAAQWVFNSWDKVTNGPDGLRIAAPNILGYHVGTDETAFPVMAALLAVMIAATMYLTTSKFGRCDVRDPRQRARRRRLRHRRARHQGVGVRDLRRLRGHRRRHVHPVPIIRKSGGVRLSSRSFSCSR